MNDNEFVALLERKADRFYETEAPEVLAAVGAAVLSLAEAFQQVGVTTLETTGILGILADIRDQYEAENEDLGVN